MNPETFWCYTGNVPNPIGIPRNTISHRKQCRSRRSRKSGRSKVSEDELHAAGSREQNGMLKPLEPREMALDNNIIDKLPADARIVRASDHGFNHFTRTIRFDTRAPTERNNLIGVYKTYFLKLLPGKKGHDIMRGEYNSSKAIHDIVPHLVARPRAWGPLAQNKNLHFFLCDFHELDSQLLNIDRFVAALAELHTKSAAQGTKFGFHVPTHIGHLAQDNHWKETWEEWFTANFERFLELEREIHGSHDIEFSALSSAMFTKVIPRLLRPMETSGRSIAASLLHGDISSANMSTSLRFNAPLIYDACSFYGHNEYDLRHFAHGRFGTEYLDAYQKLIPISEPKGDFENRMKLYWLMSVLQDGCLCVVMKGKREALKEGMKELVRKYPGGYQEYLDAENDMKDLMAQDEAYDQPRKSAEIRGLISREKRSKLG